MSDSEKEHILFLQVVVLFKMKKKRTRKIWVQELFCKHEEKRAFNNLILKIKLPSRESLFG